MFVVCPVGICPKEENPREYIADQPVEVPDTPYYRRLLADGSLIVAPAPTKKGGNA